MREFKGTRGEWEVENVITHNGDFYKVKGDISVCNITTRNQEIASANADLIAAAPELLKALLNIKNSYPEEDFKYWAESPIPTEITLHGSDFKMILEAISKAL